VRGGEGKEESSFFGKKEAKKLHPLAAGSLAPRVSSEKSFFASFFSKKEASSCLPLAFSRPRRSIDGFRP
jgi:hypothetical protein